MILEICANSYQSAMNAQHAGAHRIELCSELAVGGITPSFGLLKKVMEDCQLPIHVLIRPRSGDFSYSDEEFDIMKRDIEFCKELGVRGIVSGVLHANFEIDFERTKELIEITKPMSFTFHRAFDWVIHPFEDIVKLEEIGVNRVLTSGQQPSAEQGLDTLKKLQSLSSLIILPGGGINSNNAHLFSENGFNEVHLSVSSQIKTIEAPKISMNNSKHFDETKTSTSDLDKIQEVIKRINT